MNRKTDNELLDDVLAEAAPASFREALLDQTLRVVRRRRRLRHARNIVGVFVTLALLGLVLRPTSRPPSVAIDRPIPIPAEKSYTLISTRPLPAGSIIATLSPNTVAFITSSPTVAVVETTSGHFRVINDQQLLALVAAHPAVLVRTGPHSEQLVFANPNDAKGFPLN
ncbi:MAG TPA: hypothetical protein VMH87_04210 [Pseudomonadales bacterium]|nr:hypothetical protein [Pseudomonadales bacterium]